MICPNCHSEIAEGKKFCGKCGATLIPATTSIAQATPQALACSKCGRQVAEGKKFCGGCGTPVASQADRARGLAQTSDPVVAVTSQSSSLIQARAETKIPIPSRTGARPVTSSSPSVLTSATTSARPEFKVYKPQGRPVSVLFVASMVSVFVLIVLAAAWVEWGVELDLLSNPSGALVALDGKVLGNTRGQSGALVLPHVSRGTHILILTYPGFDAWSQSVTFGWFELSHPLTVSLPLPTFAVSIQTSPGGATIQLDGHEVGASDATGNLMIQSVPRGQHIVTALLDGYPSRSDTLWVRGPSSIRFDLAAVAAAQDAEVQAHLQRAQSLYQQRQFDAAITECNEALHLAPTNEPAAKLKGQIEQTKSILGIQ